MKKWEAPVVSELNITETAYCVVGTDLDGGTFNDQHLGILEHKGSGLDFDRDGKCDYCGAGVNSNS